MNYSFNRELKFYFIGLVNVGLLNHLHIIVR